MEDLKEGPRAARLDELQDVIQIVNSIFLPRERFIFSMSEVFPHVFTEDNLDNIRVIVRDGKPVSHLCIWEGELHIYGVWLKVGLIGCVCTHPEYRRRGYGSLLVKDALIKMKKDGVDLVMVSGFRSLYRRFGCIEAGRVYHYILEKDRLSQENINLNIEEYKGDSLRSLIEVYQREPVRYRRSINEFRLLAERGINSNIPLKIYIARIRDFPIAYVSTGLTPEERVEISEYAGSRSAVIQLLGYIQRTIRGRPLGLFVPHHDWELISLLEERGLRKPPSQAIASMAIINPESFLRKLKPYLEERMELSSFEINESKGVVKLVINGKETTFKKSEDITAFFFGIPEKVRYPLQREMLVKPYPKSLKEILPLPTPIYGLNYL